MDNDFIRSMIVYNAIMCVVGVAVWVGILAYCLIIALRQDDAND